MQEHSFSELGNHPIQILLPITPYCTPTKPLTTTYDIHQAPPLPHCCHIFPLRYSNSNNCSATRAHRPMGGCSHKQPAGKHALAARIVAQRSASPSCAMVRAGHRRMVFHVQEVCSMDAWPSRSMSRVEPSFREIYAAFHACARRRVCCAYRQVPAGTFSTHLDGRVLAVVQVHRQTPSFCTSCGVQSPRMGRRTQCDRCDPRATRGQADSVCKHSAHDSLLLPGNCGIRATVWRPALRRLHG